MSISTGDSVHLLNRQSVVHETWPTNGYSKRIE